MGPNFGQLCIVHEMALGLETFLSQFHSIRALGVGVIASLSSLFLLCKKKIQALSTASIAFVIPASFWVLCVIWMEGDRNLYLSLSLSSCLFCGRLFLPSWLGMIRHSDHQMNRFLCRAVLDLFIYFALGSRSEGFI